MKNLLTSFLLIALFAGASAQQAQTTKAPEQKGGQEKKDDKSAANSTTTPNPNAPKIVFTEESYNFSEVPEGPQVTHEFKFTNTGKEPLILSNVRASCGCTTPSWPKDPVLPGKEASILVTYNTQGRPGNFNKSITITSNSDTPTRVITIKGEVVKEDPNKSVPMEQPTMLSPKN